MSPTPESPRTENVSDAAKPAPGTPDPATSGSVTGPTSQEPTEHDHESEHAGIHALDLVRILFVAAAAAAVWFRLWEPFDTVSVIGVGATLLGGYPIFKEALTSVLSRRMTMELSMTIALLAALVIGEFFTVLVIVFFVLVAEMLEHLTVSRGRRAIKDLLDLLPHSIEVRRQDGVVTATAGDIREGDVVLVRPGARVPVDGIVEKGHSSVDQATITGESLPVEKVPGASVYAGTINQTGILEVRTTGLGKETAFGKILEAVERAEKSKAPVQKTADRYAGYLVYFALVCAGLTFAITRDARSTISVIIVAGACGIAAGTPLAILGAIGRAARGGAIIKGGIHLETLGYVDRVVLDKTGTLTYGNPAVVAIHPLEGTDRRKLLETAAVAERPSEHPVGKAIMKAAADDGIATTEPESFEYTPGKGIRCSLSDEEILVGNRGYLEERGISISRDTLPELEGSEVLVARSGRLLGRVEIADTLRPEARSAVENLKRMGYETVLLTGDAVAIAEAVGKQLGVTAVEGELLPEQKLDRLKSFQAEGRKVAMVGDGINDAPALMQADVGIAMGTGTDVARESADVVLLGGDLSKLVATLTIARRCRGIIKANFVGTILVDAVGVGLAAFGLLNPLLAAFIHVTSELAFILNSARLVPRKPARTAQLDTPREGIPEQFQGTHA